MRRSSSGRLLVAVLAVLVILLSMSLGASAANASERPFCGIWWGSLERGGFNHYSTGFVEDVRAGRHACYERVVFDIDGSAPDVHVRYVDEVLSPGKGLPVPVDGGAQLEVIIGAPTYDERYQPTITGDDIPSLVGHSTVLDIEAAGAFEGQTHVALGTRARLPFRVFTLDDPGDRSRVVIDVAHRW